MDYGLDMILITSKPFRFHLNFFGTLNTFCISFPPHFSGILDTHQSKLTRRPLQN